ncbi:MAG: winged helix DNA-binding domain-containing protein [Actinomycetota bacterium]|nr:winged helix DNA-binding domain-containing protein [Actinomycetota bacterium]
MVERTLTERELNRALLARQLLLERSELPIVRAIERVGGLQTQYAPSAYVGLWSRLAGFERDHLTSALERRRVVQATLMRGTIHIVSRRDFPLFAEGVRRARRDWWLRAAHRQTDARSIDAAARRVRSFLSDGPRRRSEIVQALGMDNVTFNGVGVWLDLVRVPPSGTWEQRRADLYGLADEWVGTPSATSEQGLDHIVRRYLGGFGPASRNDVANWAGVPAKALAPAFDRLRLRRFRDERGGELLDLPRATLPDPATPAPVRFLPTWDATLLTHARRTQILPESHRPRVFDTKTPHSIPTFIVDGHVAGSWRHEGGRVRLQPFERIPRETRRALDEEAGRLAEFLA